MSRRFDDSNRAPALPPLADLSTLVARVVEGAERQVRYQLDLVNDLQPQGGAAMRHFRLLVSRPNDPVDPADAWEALLEQRRAEATLEALSLAVTERRRAHREAIESSIEVALAEEPSGPGAAELRSCSLAAIARVHELFGALNTAIEEVQSAIEIQKPRISEHTRGLWRRICFWAQVLPARPEESTEAYRQRVLRAAERDVARGVVGAGMPAIDAALRRIG